MATLVVIVVSRFGEWLDTAGRAGAWHYIMKASTFVMQKCGQSVERLHMFSYKTPQRIERMTIKGHDNEDTDTQDDRVTVAVGRRKVWNDAYMGTGLEQTFDPPLTVTEQDVITLEYERRADQRIKLEWTVYLA